MRVVIVFVSSRPNRLRIGQIPLVGIGKALLELHARAPSHLAQASDVHELTHRTIRLRWIGIASRIATTAVKISKNRKDTCNFLLLLRQLI